MKLSTFLSVVFATILFSCQVDPKLETWIHPQLKDHLLHQPAPGAVALWKNGSRGVFFKDLESRRAARNLLDRMPMVMVSFPFNSLLAMQLAGDHRTLMHFHGNEHQAGYALVDASDSKWHARLVEAAHNHALGGLACGNVISLNLFTEVADKVTITKPAYSETVRLDAVAALTTAPKPANISATISELEALGTRRHMTASGIATPAKVEELLRAAAPNLTGMTIDLFDHSPNFPDVQQRSVIVRIAGTDPKESAIKVIAGAHLDSTNSGGQTQDAPGADDDASGVATLVEVLRSLNDSGARFKRTVELHAYAAEEDGLIGSQDIANSYRSAQIQVAAMLQLDMNAFSTDPTSQTIYLVENDTSATLRRSLKDLMHTYLDGDYVEKRLLGGTSDHKSWTTAGYPTVFPFEDPTAYNEALHTSNDTLATINNLPLSARFASLTLAFLAHHGGLEAASDQYQSLSAASALTKDLRLAIIAASDEGYYQVGVSGPESVMSVELCITDTANSPNCSEERLAATKDQSRGGRSFFVSEAAMALKAGKRLAVFGYDSSGQLLDQRTVLLQ